MSKVISREAFRKLPVRKQLLVYMLVYKHPHNIYTLMRLTNRSYNAIYLHLYRLSRCRWVRKVPTDHPQRTNHTFDYIASNIPRYMVEELLRTVATEM